MCRWRDDVWQGLSVMLVHGPGGQGKTRLVEELAERSARIGDWRVCVATHSSAARRTMPRAETNSPHVRDRLLVVVDYAERWPEVDLLSLIADHLNAGRVRILLVARPAGLWWDGLRRRLSRDLAVADAEALFVEPLAKDLGLRLEVFTTARDRFAEVLGVADTALIEPPDALAGDNFGLTLSVHMAALVAVDAVSRGAEPPKDPTGMVIYLLDREREHWWRLHALGNRHDGELDLAGVTTPPAVMARIVYLATLTRPLSYEAARDVVTRTRPSAEPAVDEALSDHARCYPPADPRTATVLEPLYPDRLGEDFLALTMPGHGHTYLTDPWAADGMLARLLAGDRAEEPPAWAGSVVTVLVEAAHRWPHLSRYLSPLLTDYPHLALAAGGATLIRLAGLPDVDIRLLVTIEAAAPPSHVDLDVGLAALARRILSYAVTVIDLAKYPAVYNRLAVRLAQAGEQDEAIAILKKLAEPRSVDYLPDRAMSLNNLCAFASQLGQYQEALSAAQQAMEIYRGLAVRDPDLFLEKFAMSLANFSASLSEVGRHDEALTKAKHATRIYRRLAVAGGDGHLPHFAVSLEVLGGCLSALGVSRAGPEGCRAGVEDLSATARDTNGAPFARPCRGPDQPWRPPL